MIYITSDLHLGHQNIIQYTGRPFIDVHEMNKALTGNWNDVVYPHDTVYVLGDFAWGDPWPYLQHLQGKKILILGNHDKPRLARRTIGQPRGFSEIHSVLEIRPTLSTGKQQRIWLSHYAHRVWPASHRGSWSLFAHSHGKLSPHGKSFDVGVDCWQYRPVSLAAVEAKMATLPGFNQSNQTEDQYADA